MLKNILATIGVILLVTMAVLASPALGEEPNACPIVVPPTPFAHYNVMPRDPDGDQRDIV